MDFHELLLCQLWSHSAEVTVGSFQTQTSYSLTEKGISGQSQSSAQNSSPHEIAGISAKRRRVHCDVTRTNFNIDWVSTRQSNKSQIFARTMDQTWEWEWDDSARSDLSSNARNWLSKCIRSIIRSQAWTSVTALARCFPTGPLP